MQVDIEKYTNDLEYAEKIERGEFSRILQNIQMRDLQKFIEIIYRNLDLEKRTDMFRDLVDSFPEYTEDIEFWKKYFPMVLKELGRKRGQNGSC